MARVLVVGGGPLQLPLIRTAKAQGHWVLVADKDPGAVGIAESDAFVHASTLDVDAISATAKSYRVDAVTTTATDQPLCAVARATAVCGLPGISEETALAATRKDLSHIALTRAGVLRPVSATVTRGQELVHVWHEIPRPVVVKPADSSGSRGVSLVRKEDELPGALHHALQYSRVGRAVVEQYIAGRELSIEGLSHDGELHVLQVTEKLTSGPPHFVELGHTQPAELTEAERRDVVRTTASAARALGISTGATHTELKMTADGPVVIEVGARPGGDYISSDLVLLSTGIDMLALVLDLSLGANISIPPRRHEAAAIRYFHPQVGRIVAIEGVDACKTMAGVVKIDVFKGVGQEIVPVTGSQERAGYVMTHARNAHDAVRIAESCVKTVKFRMA